MATNMSAIFSSSNMGWETPSEVLDRVRLVGPIALDPCTSPKNPVGAAKWVAPPDDGLETSWATEAAGGLVYVNSPYGRDLPRWASKYAVEALMGAEIVMLTPSRTDTQWFRRMWDASQAVCFWSGRIRFAGADHGAPFPSALWYSGPRCGAFMTAFSDVGRVVVL